MLVRRSDAGSYNKCCESRLFGFVIVLRLQEGVSQLGQYRESPEVVSKWALRCL